MTQSKEQIRRRKRSHVMAQKLPRRGSRRKPHFGPTPRINRRLADRLIKTGGDDKSILRLERFGFWSTERRHAADGCSG